MLHLKVSSPRILLFHSLHATKGFLQAALILALVCGLGWMGVRAIQTHFIDNKDYLIQKIELETNGFMTHERLMAQTGIDMETTIFSVDLQRAQETLELLPEIVEVELRRQMPSTLKVRLKERIPVAWIASPSLNIAGRNPHGGLLVDQEGVIFPCDGRLWDVSEELPVIEVFDVSLSEFSPGKPLRHADALRALSFIYTLREEDAEIDLDRLIVENFFSLRLRMKDSMEARIGMYEHDQALKKLCRVMAHAKASGRELQWIDLLPRHNVPGYYKDSGLLPPPLERMNHEVSLR